MGSYGTYGDYSAARVRAEFTEQFTDSNGEVRGVTDVRSTRYGHNLWGVLRVNGKPVAIELWLVTWSPPHADNPQWIYKPLTEDMGPCEYDCPLELLDICPCPDSQYARDWRARVREYHATRKARYTLARTLRHGDIITIANGETGIVDTRRIRNGNKIVACFGNRYYHVPRGMIVSVERSPL